VRPRWAALAVVLSVAVTTLLWSDRELWRHASAAIPLLSTWAFLAGATLLSVLIVVLPARALSCSQLGLTPRQLVQAVGVGVAVWLAGQLVELADVAGWGRAPLAAMDVPGDVLGGYAEELTYRVIALGAIAGVLRARIPAARAITGAILLSTLLFWLSHLPHDLVTGEINDPTRFAVRVGQGLLMAAVYLSSGNVMLAAVLHALVNGPMLVVAGPHETMLTPATNWLGCLALVLWYQRRLARAEQRR
jgi:membrane protease YdiL (CAAX protease family)